MFVWETMWRTGSSLRIVHRLVGRAGWILPTPASAEAAVDPNYQIIGCVAFWESFSISFSGWLALFTPLCQHLVCPHWCGMSVNEQNEAAERIHAWNTFNSGSISPKFAPVLSVSLSWVALLCLQRWQVNMQYGVLVMCHSGQMKLNSTHLSAPPRSVHQGHEHKR